MEILLRSKILNNECCRLCLSEKFEDLRKLDGIVESGLTARGLVEKFNVVALSSSVELITICSACISTLESFYKFHLVAQSSRSEILEILQQELKPPTDEIPKTELAEAGTIEVQNEVLIEFLNIDGDVESDNEADFQDDAPSDFQAEESSFECDICPRIYKRKTLLARHLARHHLDGLYKPPTRLFNCDLCGEKFTERDELDNHCLSVTCITSPECRFCNEVFSHLTELKTHIELNHIKSRQHSCPICFKLFPSSSNRNSHLQSHNAENTFKCTDCDQGFKSLLYLKKHQKSIHTTAVNTCQVCDRTFLTQQRFDYHMKSHDAVKRYKCSHEGCLKSFLQHHHLENHKATHSGIKKFLCFVCGRNFRQDCNLKAHLKTHSTGDEKNFKCKDCEKSFKLLSSLRSHMKIHDAKSQCQCPECGRSFSQRSLLRSHFQTHFRDPCAKPFKCSQVGCEKSFFQERSIHYHNSVAHEIGEPTTKKSSKIVFHCEQCSRTFTLKSLLKRHVLTHTETEQKIRKYKCEHSDCEAIFKRAEHLNGHLNSVHLKIRPHKCAYPGCEKSFTQVGDKNIHMKIHSNDKPYVCMVCQKSFRLKKGLRAHERTHANKKSYETEREMSKNLKEVDCDGTETSARVMEGCDLKYAGIFNATG